MTPVDPVRPGSALTDVNLREALLERLRGLESEAKAAGRLRGIPSHDRFQEVLDVWSVLAVYPWQRFNYRYGRWWPEIDFLVPLLTVTLWERHHWVKDYKAFQILDPYSGKAVAQFDTLKRVLEVPGGALEFAGELGSVGVYRPLGGDLETITPTAHSWRGLYPSKEIVKLREGADKLPPPNPNVDLEAVVRHQAWFADSPDKPGRRAPNLKFDTPWRTWRLPGDR